MARLRRLILNFASMDPLQVGGAARLAQCLARHLSENAPPGTECLAVLGHRTWAQSFPLEGPFRQLDGTGLGKPALGWALEQAFGAPGPGRRLRVLAGRLASRTHRFPAAWSRDTVVHVPTQTIHPLPPRHWNLPYAMNLADLQHEHFPEFFSAKDLRKRRERFLASAQAAAAVFVADAWTKRDILAHMPLDPDRIHAVPLAPTWDPADAPGEAEARALVAAEGLPERFAFYPAQTWAHKNHARLFEALAALRERGLRVSLVCTGQTNAHYPVLQQRLRELELEDQVRFLGLVPEALVKALYRACALVVVPTLFEGGPGIPVLEALALGRPLAASTVCGIPEAAGEAGLLFDPLEPAAMAAAVEKLWTDPSFAAELGARGAARMASRSWAGTARAYHEVYASVLERAGMEGAALG
jgi:glycosyltransferase involved in cell wall biosynthesis